jgi:hypothetical protein
MNDTPQQAAEKAVTATKSAEEAAQESKAAAQAAEKAAGRVHWIVGIGFLFALVGAVLAFALKDSDASVLGVSLRPLGGVLFAAGVLVLGGVAVSAVGNNGPTSAGPSGNGENRIKEVGGLIAVVSGVAAVAILAIVTLTQLSGEKSSIVAVSSSAFGVISAVVGAYLGIKASGDQNVSATADAKDAAVAQHVADVAASERDAATDVAKAFVTPDQANAIQAAKDEARAKVATRAHPARGGRHT